MVQHPVWKNDMLIPVPFFHSFFILHTPSRPIRSTLFCLVFQSYRLQNPKVTSAAIILPQWGAMETVTSWECLAGEKSQVVKKHRGSATLLWSTDPVWFSMLALDWAEIVHCRRNTPFWIERKHSGLCISAHLPAQPQGKIFFFLNQQSRESRRHLQQVTDRVCGEQCSLKLPSLLGCRRILGACFSCQSVESSNQLGSFRDFNMHKLLTDLTQGQQTFKSWWSARLSEDIWSGPE